jgi:phytoene desaturase
MSEQHMVIIGGGLAGLSTGCYARANGFKTTVLEHNLALGGVCTAWQRGPYTVDGCIHWLTGGPFLGVYRELGIIPPVTLRPIQRFATYRNVEDGFEVEVTDDVEKLRQVLQRLGPDDAREVDRMIAGARAVAEMDPGLETPPELASLRQQMSRLWDLREQVGEVAHFRHSVREWGGGHLKSARLRRFVSSLAPEESPTLVLLFMLGYLGRGWLSRPIGGTTSFRDALISRYLALGGETHIDTTVEEILVEGDRAIGVRTTDGTIVDADVVVSTSSGPETVLRLLAGRYGAEATRLRLEKWKMFSPILLVSYGVDRPMSDVPGTLVLDGMPTLRVGGREDAGLTVRIFNDEPAVAPPGHTVVQVQAQTDYAFWATRGTGYGAAKEAAAATLLSSLEPVLPGLRQSVRMTDVATPLTFWRNARSWRGAFEGWLPTPESFFGHVDKTLPGLKAFYMAGQWVEPGGGVPTALLSGRHAVQIACNDIGRPFASSTGA